MPRTLPQLTPEAREEIARKLAAGARPETLADLFECGVTTIRGIGYKSGVFRDQRAAERAQVAYSEDYAEIKAAVATKQLIFGRITLEQFLDYQELIESNPSEMPENLVRNKMLSPEELGVVMRSMERCSTGRGNSLLPDQIRDARLLRAQGVPSATLSVIYGVSQATISRTL